MYHRLRRASLRIRSCMTSFLKRLRRLSCDSPSRRLTVANTLTSFQRKGCFQSDVCAGHRKPGLRIIHWTAAGLARLWLFHTAPCLISKPLPSTSYLRSGRWFAGNRQSTWRLLSSEGPPQRPPPFASLHPPSIQELMLGYYNRFLSISQS
jgi:hypothetical protein